MPGLSGRRYPCCCLYFFEVTENWEEGSEPAGGGGMGVRNLKRFLWVALA
jgi:hypothetical protein